MSPDDDVKANDRAASDDESTEARSKLHRALPWPEQSSLVRTSGYKDSSRDDDAGGGNGRTGGSVPLYGPCPRERAVGLCIVYAVPSTKPTWSS